MSGLHTWRDAVDAKLALLIGAAALAGVLLAGCGSDGTPSATGPREWATYGQSQSRTFFNSDEDRITAANAGSLRTKWHYLTGAVVTASPSVAFVDVPGEGRIKVVYVSSWDGNVYSLRASNGSQLWHYVMKPHPGASYPQASSAEITTVAGEQRVYVGGGMTVYCFSAASGALRWMFDAGTGCSTCGPDVERNEVLSSPTVVGDLVYFGMDVNDSDPGKGGIYAVSALDGRLVWYLDVETLITCRPHATDNVRRFDGFHTASELGLPADFFSTRPGCDFSRVSTACGNIWSSFAVDYRRRLIYSVSSNCDTDDDPSTPEPPPPMPPYDEAIFAITFDGNPAWVWRPREVDNDDLAFGGVPNLFEVEIGGATRQVVGVGGKDGTYYLLDRDGVNPLTQRIEPYWHTQVVPGGEIGGIIASASVGEGNIFFSTAIGRAVGGTQHPSAWSLRANDGGIRWSNPTAPANFGPTTAIPDVVFMGGISFSMLTYDAAAGTKVGTYPLGGPVSSAAALLDGEVFVGEGTGARGGSPAEIAFKQSTVPSYVTAFCLPDASDCPAELCDDGEVCTYDFHTADGCESEPAPDTIVCTIEGKSGHCRSGVCQRDAG